MSKKSVATLLVSASVLSLMIHPASVSAQAVDASGAQTTPAGTKASQSGGTSSPQQVEEVVVTATRDKTSAQRTPVALNVYSGQALEQQDIHNVLALQSIDPSLNITLATGTPYIALRGVESTNTTEVGNPAVSVARDGFFTNRTFSLANAFFDLDRVEVLKGPQGTLFGRNSTGGLVDIISATPKLGSFGGYGVVEAGNYNLENVEAALNLPVGDTLAVRLSGFERSRDGYREVTGVNIRGDDDESSAGRAQLLWRPNNAFDALLSYEYDRVGGYGDVPALGSIGAVYSGSSKSYSGYEVTHTHVTDALVRWVLNYHDLPYGMTLTYSGGNDLTNFYHVGDDSGYNPSGAFTLATFGGGEHVTTVNHEIRLATPTDRRFTFQGGAFYFWEHNAPLVVGETVRGGPYTGQSLVAFDTQVKTLSRALFGQAGYALLPNLRLSVGARYTWDSVVRTGSEVLNCEVAGIPPFLYGLLGCTGAPPSIVTVEHGRQAEQKATYHLGLDWNITDRSMAYVKYDTGYKPGGFDSDPSNLNLSYGPEIVKSFELGTKNVFFQRRLTLNADVFDMSWNGYQATAPTSLLSSGSGIVNIGSAESYGAEVQLIAQLDPQTRLDANATFLHGRFGSNLPGVSAPSGNGTVDISGNKLPNAPSTVITAGLQHDFAVWAGRLTARVDGKYSSAFFYDMFNLQDTRSPEYATGNASLSFTRPGSPWRVEAFVRNFTDATVFAHITRFYLTDDEQYEFQPPRTEGVQVTYKF